MPETLRRIFVLHVQQRKYQSRSMVSHEWRNFSTRRNKACSIWVVGQDFNVEKIGNAMSIPEAHEYLRRLTGDDERLLAPIRALLREMGWETEGLEPFEEPAYHDPNLEVTP